MPSNVSRLMELSMVPPLAKEVVAQIAGGAGGVAAGLSGTFTANGATPVTVSNTKLAAGDNVLFTLATVGGTVGATPTIKTRTNGTGFTVAATASDTSVYNYRILKA